MKETEGVIQYRLRFAPGQLPPDVDCGPLFDWFERCRRHGLIGQDPARYDGLAFGNISLRAARGFVISGTQTGGQFRLSDADLAWVTDFDVTRNSLRATGPARPSSEAMTHGQLYTALRWANAVIHAHCAPIWSQATALGLAVTSPDASYGTPQMATEVERLATAAAPGQAGMLVMGGHEDGVIAFGPDMDSAGRYLLDTLQQAQALSAGTAE